MKLSRYLISIRAFDLGFLVLLACLLPVTLACSGGENPSSTQAPEHSTEEHGAQRTVEYEPAYPEDVSTEGLSESDKAQQERLSHGEGGHEHDAEGDHEHDEEGDPGHGADSSH